MASSAPIYSIADELRAHAESAAWARFTRAADRDEFCNSWLSLLAARIERARAALLLTSGADAGAFVVTAVWPDPQRDLQYLGPTAQRALVERRGVVSAPDGGEPAADGAAHVGYPVEVSGRLVGAVVVDVGPNTDLQASLRQIHWSIAWLIDHFRQQELAERVAELDRVALLNDLMATALQHRRLQASALAVANELAGRLRCDRVSIGFEKGEQIRPLVLSHTATFDARADLVRWLGEAMDEAFDLGVPIIYPPPAQDELGAIAHAESARSLKVAAMVSVPMKVDGRTVGVMTLERNAGPALDADDLRRLQALAVMLGPFWALQRANERGALSRAIDTAADALRSVTGPRHPGLKLLAGLAAIALVAVALVHVEYRVSARTVIEGSTQLASVAPFDGFVAEGMVRAGDTVRKGDTLARLDDRDLKLERARWDAEREQLRRKLQVAMAQADRGTMGVLAAQISQVEAQLTLAEERLSRATLTAPFDGIIVSGDLSQQIGTPVERGKLLFEVAPLAGYRVVLQVDDRDIAQVAEGQRGELVLSSLPDLKMPFVLRLVTPVATQQDGRNVFRVEAQVEGATGRLRPGMEGIGKVTVGERSLLWIWTHRFVEWLRLSLWNWMP